MEKLRINTERLFLRSPNINVCFRIKIDRELNPEDLSAAINIVCKRHPLLTSSILKENNEAWFVPNLKPIKAEYFRREEMPDWKIWYTREDNKPFDFANESPVRFSAIAGDDQTEIIILGHHIIGDGIAYFNLAKDLLSALDNNLAEDPQIPPANDTFIKGNKLSFLSRIYAGRLNKEWRKNKKHFSEDDYLAFFRDYRNSFIPQVYLSSVNEDNLKRLTAVCRQNKLTVNELITSAFASAFSPDKEVRIGVAASTRGELITDPQFCMGNYVTGISVKANCISTNDFILNTKNLAKTIRGQLTDVKKRHAVVNFLKLFDGDLIESIMFASYGNFPLPISQKIGIMIAEGMKERGLGISNLGRHEINNYKNFSLSDMEFIGPAFPANIISVSVITVNNKLNICLRYNDVDINSEDVERNCNKAIKLMLG